MTAQPSTGPTGLARYDEMTRAILACESVDEVKDIRDKARALEMYMAQAEDRENERRALNVRLRAERRCGQLLAEMKANGERASAGAHQGNQHTGIVERNDVSRLSDLGITRDQSSRFQQLAEVPEEDFESALADPAKKPSTAGIIRETRPSQPPKMDPCALWLWGRMREMERDGLLTRDPATVAAVMTDAMRDDVCRLAPAVAAWFSTLEGSCDG